MRKISNTLFWAFVLLSAGGRALTAHASLSLQQYSEIFWEKVHVQEPFGHTAKIDLMSTGVVVLDGTGEQNQVSNEDRETEVTLTMSADTLDLLINEKISAIKAFIGGSIKIEGDKSLVPKLAVMLGIFPSHKEGGKGTTTKTLC